MSQAYSTPSIPPDALHLSLYPEPATAASRPATVALAAQLRSAIVELLPVDWIWHRDPLELKVEELRSRLKGGETQWVIRGGMRVGESIEDEWVGVWLVRELTRRFQDVVGSYVSRTATCCRALEADISPLLPPCFRVYDADGDFLLIEAAAVLPDWVSPQNSENRLFLARGELHLLPLSVSSPATTRPAKHERRLTLDDDDDDEGSAEGWLEEWKGVQEVRAGGHKWRDVDVERAVWERIAG
jgi:hypothetical protein